MRRIITVVLMLTLVLSSLPVAYANNEAVIIEDPNLEIAIRQAINKPTGEIMQDDMEKLLFIEVRDKNIDSLVGLEHAINLESLIINSSNNNISDLSPLTNLIKLQCLEISNSNISDTSALSDLPKLDVLDLSNNDVNDLRPLENLLQLRVLRLGDNNVKDIKPLSKLTELDKLILNNNNINDISPLLPFDTFDEINIDNNPLWEDDGTNKMLGEVTGEEVNKPVYEVWTEPKAKAVVITEGNIESKRDDNSALPIILTTIGGLFIVVFIFMNNKNLKIYAVEDSNDTWAVRMLGKRKIKVHSEEISIDISKELSEIEDEKLKIVFNSSLSVKLLNKKITFIKDNNTFAEITLNESVNIIEITKDGEITVIKK